MALYHFASKALSRRTRNTVRAVAYRAGCEVKDIQTGETFSYSKKDVACVELLLPNQSPIWALKIQTLVRQNRQAGVQALVDRIEAAEKRLNSRVWREIEIALPRELSHIQNITLAKEFVQDQPCGRGMCALLNFHFDKDQGTGEGKPHCHILLTTRSLGESGFRDKVRDWNQRELLCELREQWAAYANFHLKLHGHETRIDHRSYLERGIELEPQPKQGRSVLEQELIKKKGEGSPSPITEKAQDFRDVKLRNLYRLLRRPEIVLEMVSKNYATFMWSDVQRILYRYIDDSALFQKMELRLQASQELVLLEIREDRGGEGSVYTTQAHLKAENALMKSVEMLDPKSHGVEKKYIKTALREANNKIKAQGNASGLSKDQKHAIHHFVEKGQLKCGVGMAGAGKTTALGVCQKIWTQQGYAVYGVAPTGKAAQNLSQSGINSMTLHKFLKSFEDGRCQYKPHSVLVLDEAGMVDVERFSKLLQAIDSLKVKLVIIGDGAQLQPVAAGPAFRLITARVRSANLMTILRQSDSWQREATRLFGEQKTEEAIKTYQEKGYVHLIDERIPSLKEAIAKKDISALRQIHGFAAYVAPRLYREMMRERRFPLAQHPDYTSYLKWKSREKATENYVTSFSKVQDIDPRKVTKDSLLKSWHMDFQKCPGSSFLVLAFSNKDVEDLNQRARFLLKQSGHLSKEEILYKTAKETEDDFGKKISVFTRKAFSKGDQLIFTRNHYGLNVRNGTRGTIVSLNRSLITVRLQNENRTLSFAPALNPFFDHGWAMTIHKAQGTTTDRTYLLASYDMTQNLTYVAMTRHRKEIQVFGGSLDFGRSDKLPQILSQSGEKLAAQDYLGIDELNKRLETEDNLLNKVFIRLSDELVAIGAVSNEVFRKVVSQFLGRAREPESIIKSTCISKGIREEERAQKILSPQHEFWKNSLPEGRKEFAKNTAARNKENDILK